MKISISGIFNIDQDLDFIFLAGIGLMQKFIDSAK